MTLFPSAFPSPQLQFNVMSYFLTRFLRRFLRRLLPQGGQRFPDPPAFPGNLPASVCAR